MENGLRPEVEHVVWPGLLRVERDDGTLTLYNPGHGTSLDVEPESQEMVNDVLNAFAEPRTLAWLFEEHEVPVELMVLMVRSGFVVERAELAFLEHGFLRPTPAPVGPAWAWSDLPELAVAGTWLVVGAPVDMAAAGHGGARHGPYEIRRVVNGALLSGDGEVVDHDFERLYPSFQPQVADLGDVDPDGGRQDHVGMRLAKVVREVAELGMRPLLLGGDHSLTHYTLDALLAVHERFGIIHFDAHADLGPSRTLSHGNVFGSALASERVASMLQIGLRGIERINGFARRVPCEKRTFVSARNAMGGAAMRALVALPKDIPYYLSFDIDCIDGAVARETGTPLFGGLSFDLASELVDYIARNFSLLGADFMEVGSGPGPHNAAALIAASLLQRVLLGDSEFEPLGSDIHVI